MTRCPNCNREQPASVILCDCGYNLEKYGAELKEKNARYEVASRAYQWLSIFRGMLRLAGGITIISGLIYDFTLYSNEESFALVLVILAATIIAAVPSFAFAEAISVLLDLHTQNDEILSRLERIEKRLP